MLFGGRWNHKGIPLLYTSESLSLAALEVIANLSSSKLNRGLYCTEITFPNHLEISEVGKLPKSWNIYPYSAETVAIGTNFVKEGGLCLKVPSAIIPSEYNFLINPTHEKIDEVQITDTRPLMLDHRLMRNLKL